MARVDFIPLGSKIRKDNVSLIAQIKSVSKQNVFLSDDLIKDTFKASQKYLNTIYGEPEAATLSVEIIEYTKQFDSANTFYKYITRESMEKYYKKGYFRLGTLLDYQNAKVENIKDRREGHTHLVLESKERQLLQSFYGGFNYLVFCGSYIPPDDPRSDYLKKKFGSCVMKVSNIQTFKKAIQKHLNICRSHYRQVDYHKIKAFKKTIDFDLDEDMNEIFPDKTFKEINNITSEVSIFYKRDSYSPEHEMRFAFEMPCDQKHPKDLHNKGLLDYVEFIE
ncbi:MAG: hypothetical protein RIM99_06405 [Cyclobacteriaceae bacterium]